MERTLVKDLESQTGKTVTVMGFAETIRDQKAVQFIVLREQTGKVQLVNERTDNTASRIISDLTPESSIIVTGKVIKNDRVKLGGLEIMIEKIEVASPAEAILPINVVGEKPSLEKRMDHRFLDLRRPDNHLIFKIQTTAEHAMREFWLENGFIEIHSPKLMGTASESGAELFTVKNYFGREAYLAQSPQFYKQMGMGAGFDRVFEIGPVFRANPSFTSRHDTEFTSIDMEISWIESHEDVMTMEERWIQYFLKAIKEKHGEEIKEKFGTEFDVPTLPFPRVTMAEAQKIIAATGYKMQSEVKGDLDPEGERVLAKHIKETKGHDFVFVIDYPISVRPFYHMRHTSDPEKTKSFDLLFRGLEVTTGAQREHRYDILVKQAKEKGLSIEPMKSYLECFKYGTPPHGGLGFGLTRMLMTILGLPNVREVTFLYRGPNRLDP